MCRVAGLLIVPTDIPSRSKKSTRFRTGKCPHMTEKTPGKKPSQLSAMPWCQPHPRKRKVKTKLVLAMPDPFAPWHIQSSWNPGWSSGWNRGEECLLQTFFRLCTHPRDEEKGLSVLQRSAITARFSSFALKTRRETRKQHTSPLFSSAPPWARQPRGSCLVPFPSPCW